MSKFKIVNWKKYQHYKDRRPPWIKLYSKLLRKYEFIRLQDDSKLLLMFLWLLASTIEADEPEIESDEQYLKTVIPYRSKIDLKPLVEAGFIEMIAECAQDDSEPQATCTPYKEETYKEEAYKKEAKTEPLVMIPESLNTKEFLDAWKQWLSFRIEIRKRLTESTMSKQLTMLSKYPVNVAIEIIEKSILNGWQGLFPDKVVVGNCQQPTGIPQDESALKAQKMWDKEREDKLKIIRQQKLAGVAQ